MSSQRGAMSRSLCLDSDWICLRCSWERKGTCHISAMRACSYREQGKAPTAVLPSPQMAAELRTLSPGHVFLVTYEAASLWGKQSSLSVRSLPASPLSCLCCKFKRPCFRNDSFLRGEDRGARANFLQNRLLGRKPEVVARKAHGGTGTAVPRRSPARFHMISIREGHPAVSHHLPTRARHMCMSTKHPVFQVPCIFPPRSLFLPLGAHLILQYSLFYSPRPVVTQNIHIWIQFTECLVALLVLNTK